MIVQHETDPLYVLEYYQVLDPGIFSHLDTVVFELVSLISYASCFILEFSQNAYITAIFTCYNLLCKSWFVYRMSITDSSS